MDNFENYNLIELRLVYGDNIDLILKVETVAQNLLLDYVSS